MTSEIQWPEKIFLRELDENHNGCGQVVLSKFATVARFEGCPETDREFQKYVDGDIFDSAVKYWTERDLQRADRIAELETQLAATSSGSE